MLPLLVFLYIEEKFNLGGFRSLDLFEEYEEGLKMKLVEAAKTDSVFFENTAPSSFCILVCFAAAAAAAATSFAWLLLSLRLSIPTAYIFRTVIRTKFYLFIIFSQNSLT